jgi:hypothetical protein
MNRIRKPNSRVKGTLERLHRTQEVGGSNPPGSSISAGGEVVAVVQIGE